MSANTRPPGMIPLATPRSVWSSRDETALQELLERKQRIMTAHRETLNGVLSQVLPGIEDESMLNDFIALAEPLRDALAPFDSRGV